MKLARQSLFFRRFQTKEVMIGDRAMGGKHPIRIQSMTSTHTLDVPSTIHQCIKIFEAGADYVRISAPNMEAARALLSIKNELKTAGFTKPLIADIHFNAAVALEAARYVEKIRINPGNYMGNFPKDKMVFTPEDTQKQLNEAREKLAPLVKVCKEYGTAIRIGTNLGSLSPRIIAQHGNTARGMVAATMEFIRLFEDLHFDKLVISLKASKPLLMVEAYEKMVEEMMASDMSYPLHIGITEAGEGENGRIKSALGINTLLKKGLGDTLRVSLSEDPEKEIPFGHILAHPFQDAFQQEHGETPFQIQSLQPLEVNPLPQNQPLKVWVAESSALNKYAHKTYAPLSLVPDFIYGIPNDILDDEWGEHGKGYFYNAQTGHKEIVLQPQTEEHTSQEISYWQIVESKNLNADNKPIQAVMYALDFEKDTSRNLSEWAQKCATQGIPFGVKIMSKHSSADTFIAELTSQLGVLLLERKIHLLWLHECVLDNAVEILFGLLQSSGLRISKTEFISCPTCARTSFDLQSLIQQVQREFSDYPGLKIAVMGCIVNGPGEMADADYGFVGSGSGKVHLYKGKRVIEKSISPDQACHRLKVHLK